MVLLLGHERVPLSLLKMSSYGFLILLLVRLAARFASRAPTWRLPVSGQVAGLVTADLGVAEDDGVEGARSEVLLA